MPWSELERLREWCDVQIELLRRDGQNFWRITMSPANREEAKPIVFDHAHISEAVAGGVTRAKEAGWAKPVSGLRGESNGSQVRAPSHFPNALGG